jgi:bifunctional UDP-N-acetylglucosamine pyrophosphorylase/glucosamine-1-phosphate N-acetyltransferase|tara:strand:- start:1867 stop:3219 length:1353 start_codon:yes stop_codon:yes gene_type:complete
LNTHTILLAGGKGTRMLSKKAKVLQTLAGKSFLEHIFSSTKKISNKISVVVGFDKNGVEKEVSKLSKIAKTFEQKNQIGTADAVKTVIEFIKENEKVLILYGDVPLIQESSLKKLCSLNNSLSILTTNFNDPTGYGRVVKNSNGFVEEIVEEKDTSTEQKNIKEVFTGVMVVNGKILKDLLPLINNNNTSKEFYLTDLIGIANKNGFKIDTLSVSWEETLGANTRYEQEKLEQTYRKMKNEKLLENGITLIDKNRVDVRGDLLAGTDCTIDINVIFEGKVELGNNVKIGANSIISNTKIDDNSEILPFSHVDASQIGKDCSIGPYARLREGSVIADGVRIGNFVETKKTKIGKSTKANHFSYLGDANIGGDVNIGAGTITCNYDGKNKNKTHIGDSSFIGTNSSLVAPINIGKNVYVGAGSTITKDIPDNSLGISRSKQKNVKDWPKNKK